MRTALVCLALALSLDVARAASASVLQSGSYVTDGFLDRLSELTIEIHEGDQFVARFVWFDDVAGPTGLQRHEAEIRGRVILAKDGTVVFSTTDKPLRWPLDQEFEFVSETEIRLPQGYLTKGPTGWTSRPEDKSYLAIKKKKGEPGATDNPDGAQ